MPEELTQDEEMMQAAQDASKLQTTLATPGWTEIIRPEIEARREYFLAILLSRQERMEDVMYAQQCVLVIDALLKMIEHDLAKGKRAIEHFSAKKGEKQE